VSEVQAQDPEERQPREARVYLVPQGVSRPFRPPRPLEPSPEPGLPCLNSPLTCTSGSSDEELHLASLRGMGMYVTVMDSGAYLKALAE